MSIQSIRKIEKKSILVSSDNIPLMTTINGIVMLCQDTYYTSLEGFIKLYQILFKNSVDNFNQRIVFLWVVSLMQNQHPEAFGFNNCY